MIHSHSNIFKSAVFAKKTCKHAIVYYVYVWKWNFEENLFDFGRVEIKLVLFLKDFFSIKLINLFFLFFQSNTTEARFLNSFNLCQFLFAIERKDIYTSKNTEIYKSVYHHTFSEKIFYTYIYKNIKYKSLRCQKPKPRLEKYSTIIIFVWHCNNNENKSTLTNLHKNHAKKHYQILAS